MRRLATALLVPLSVLAACNRGGTKQEALPPAPVASTTVLEPTTTEPPTTAPRTPEQVVVDDYLAGWDALRAAAEVRDPNHPALVDLYRGDALERLQNYIRGLVQKNRTTRGTLTHDIRSVTINGTEAVVHDCTDDQYLEYDADGRQVGTAEGRNGSDNRLRLEEGRWRTFVIYDLPAACS
ncbi:MAG: hypothetical protein KY454_08390 [Actinobacteria bacterium]|nr:hypothetical protein [Actinomycetota bacterium]MBW3650774.1 hypothetical protein [Actinomycetota bacterium]